ncbi:mycofactocin system transcriptional regulator [Leucobacter luti]|uniref:mycofactocin system transcriptional regulator n=1 Tax=Leucobacter luti TaxID=340320 RepID=UPI003CFBFFAD
MDPESREAPEMASPSDAGASRVGRAPATTHGELSHTALTLFMERGFDEVTMDDIAREAGVGRRTLFRYFSSKNELPWGDFSSLLVRMRAQLAAIDPEISLLAALRSAIRDFNTFPDSELDYHRGRMRLLLTVPSLNAYSTLKYADWREVIAEFVGSRRNEPADGIAAQTIAWACLGMSIASYERWLDDESADLLTLLDEAFISAESVFGLQGE